MRIGCALMRLGRALDLPFTFVATAVADDVL
jgi:hypothetical protein